MAKRKQRNSPRIIYLACEGTQTEYWYFKSLDEALDDDAEVKLQVYPDPSDLEEIRQTQQKGVKTDHKSLCAKAAEKLQSDEGINEAWIVIDKDRHSGLEQTFAQAAQTGVRIAFSSISFEHWLLLHFEKNDKAFEKSDCKNEDEKYVKCGSSQTKNPNLNCQGKRCVAGLLRLRDYLPDFDKSNQIIFKTTQPLHPLAYENAAWLRWRKQNDLEATGGKVFQINPYSNVDELLKSIYQDDEVIIWIAWGTPAKTNDFELTVQKSGNDYQVNACNISGRSQVILPTYFFLSNDDTERLSVEFSFLDDRPNFLVLPNQTVEFEILLYTLPEGTFYLNSKFGNYRLIYSE